LRRIELEDDDPATVERMISYMYTFDYKDEQHLDPESDSCNSVSPDEMMEDPTREHQSTSDHGEHQPPLISSVRVYAIADKYNIPPLKELARDRFSNWAKDNWAREDFSDIVREIFESTPKSDRGLRDIVIQIATIHADVLTQKDKFRQLMEDIGDLGLNLLCQVLKIHSEEKSGLESRIEYLEADTEELKRKLKEGERSLRHKSDEMDSTMNIINNMDECDHCKIGFNIEVERYYAGRATIRCKGCRTRHYQ
jgi:hypothetical protein